MGLGWKNSFGKGNAEDTITSGIEGAWSPTPTRWDNSYLELLFTYDWKQTKSPAGATQWIPTNESAANLVPDAHLDGKFHAPMMTTADLALKFDPEYNKISIRFLKDFEYFSDVFARAWFKLTHRDMGPVSRYLGKEVPSEILIWQDPVPLVKRKTISDKNIKKIKKQILDSGLSISDLVNTAWASASTFRKTDKRGGANGARIRLQPQISWDVNDTATISKVLAVLESIKTEMSMADLIVLGGCAAIEKSAEQAGIKLSVPFTQGRTDASQDQTDVDSFSVLEPQFDGFRNYINWRVTAPEEVLLVEKANLLNLNPVELVLLLSGIRMLNKNNLDNTYLAKLLSYTNASEATNVPRIDLIIASNSELRAIAEVYASNDARDKFFLDFANAWSKVMDLDRFDIKKGKK
jgi:catalase-peroxidase